MSTAIGRIAIGEPYFRRKQYAKFKAAVSISGEIAMLTSKAILAAAPGPGAPTVDFSGRWANELGSVMRLTINGQRVTGDYTSPVSGGGGTVQGTLVGFVDGDLIAFVVNWDGPASLTAWTGQLVRADNRDTIKTLWHLVMNVPDANEPTGLWQSTLAGADEFTRG